MNSMQIQVQYLPFSAWEWQKSNGFHTNLRQTDLIARPVVFQLISGKQFPSIRVLMDNPNSVGGEAEE